MNLLVQLQGGTVPDGAYGWYTVQNLPRPDGIYGSGAFAFTALISAQDETGNLDNIRLHNPRPNLQRWVIAQCINIPNKDPYEGTAEAKTWTRRWTFTY